MAEPEAKPEALDPQRVEEVMNLVAAMRKRMFWFNTVVVCMLLMVAVVGVAQYLGINARSPGWEPMALIAAFGAICTLMIVALIGFAVRHMQAHRMARAFMDKESKS